MRVLSSCPSSVHVFVHVFFQYFTNFIKIMDNMDKDHDTYKRYDMEFRYICITLLKGGISFMFCPCHCTLRNNREKSWSWGLSMSVGYIKKCSNFE